VLNFINLSILCMQNNRFDEPVLQHLVNANCTPCLLYGAEVIEWNKSDLSSIPLIQLCVKFIKLTFSPSAQCISLEDSEIYHQRSNTCVSNFYVSVFLLRTVLKKLLCECFCAS